MFRKGFIYIYLLLFNSSNSDRIVGPLQKNILVIDKFIKEGIISLKSKIILYI